MEFRLVYEGALPGSGNNSRHPKEKHQIRKVFHRQLAHLWETHPLLKLVATRFSPPTALLGAGTFRNIIAKENEKFGFHFVPLVNEAYGQVCSLDILLLRREKPGNLITQSGDIDNRVKTLFDALSVPDSDSGLTPPEPGEEPFFYCVLQKDSLVTKVSVTTDQLLTPLEPNETRNHVQAVLNVTVRAAATMMWGNLIFKE